MGTPVWATSATRSATVQPISSRELIEAGQVRGELTHRVWLRYDSDTSEIAPHDRLKFGSRILEVISVINTEERNEQIEVLCKEAV
jgi:SPP1 family predicted phage head-tail adaptor